MRYDRVKIILPLLFLLLSSTIVLSMPLELAFPHFKPLSAENGDGALRIHALVEDSRGYLWSGSLDRGLQRFDGYTFQSFPIAADSPEALPEMSVHSLHEDREGLLWIGMDNYICFFSWKTESFEHFPLPLANDSKSAVKHVETIAEDNNGNIWLCTPNGLYHIIKDGAQASWQIHHILPNPENPHAPENGVQDICFDNAGRLWIAAYTGLGWTWPQPNNGKLDIQWLTSFPEEMEYPHSLEAGLDGEIIAAEYAGLYSVKLDGEKKLTHFYPWPQSQSEFSPFPVNMNNLLWIVNVRDKVRAFDLKSKKFCNIPIDLQDTNGIANHHVLCKSISKDGDVFLGTAWAGIFRYSRDERFTQYHPSLRQLYLNDNNNLRYSYIDTKDRLWIILKKIYLCDRISGQFIEINSPNKYIQGIYKNCIYEDDNRTIWFGSEGEGLLQFDEKTNMLRLSDFLHQGIVSALAGDRNGCLWVGTLDVDAVTGIKSTNIHCINKDRTSIITDTLKIWARRAEDKDEDYLIYHIRPDNDGSVWLATGFGVVQYHPQRGIVKHFQHDKNNPESLSSNNIKTICIDPGQPEKYLWCGTLGAGLNRLDKQNGTCRKFTKADNLPGNFIGVIEKDHAGYLWIGTDNGIICMYPSTQSSQDIRFWHFNEGNGIEGKNFNSYYGHDAQVTRNGEMVFNSGGINIFNPASVIQKDIRPLQVDLNGMEINYKIASYHDENSPLAVPIHDLETISLKHNENNLILKFAAVKLKNAAGINYAFTLEGLDKEWIEIGNRRQVYFPGLNPGRYTFNVRAAFPAHEYGPVKHLHIYIAPPWYGTPGAYIIYSLSVILLFSFAFYVLKRRNALHTALYEKELEAEKISELNEMKSRFFANISHEFRTPLTLISGPLERMLLQMPDHKHQKNIVVMKRHLDHIQQLVNNLLSLARLEADQLKLRPAQDDLVTFLRVTVASFESAAQQKALHLQFETTLESLVCILDPEKLRDILFNLISNAIKFTPENGSITISLKKCSGEFHPHCTYRKGCARIAVADTGIGIPEEKLPYIYDRFYQVDETQNINPTGTGIGLALVKELVKLHKGQVHVQSKLTEGSVFTINLPLEKEHLLTLENGSVQSLKDDQPIKISLQTPHKAGKSLDVDIADDDADLILVIDDNAELREYIAQELQGNYRVMTAGSGSEGITIAFETVPDLVISDVMMPGKDGFDVAHILKSDERTSHIPVILLTAKIDQESRLQGLRTGADDYLAKPFNTLELLVRIHNLIEQRIRLAQYFKNGNGNKSNKNGLSTIDSAFLEKISSVLHDNLSDENFSVPELFRAVGMSRSQLHRKLKAITGASTSEYIQNFRLQKAAELLSDSDKTISEVAYQVGFSDPAYFSRAFKKNYDLTPTEFVKEKHKE